MLCTQCRHPLALHGNGNTPCRAIGCSAGPEGKPCPHFVNEEDKAKTSATAAA